MHDQEREQLERAISNSKAQNYRKKFEEKRDKSVLRKDINQFVGMANLGNTCYFNSMMQILYFSDCFADKICSYKSDKTQIKSFKKDKGLTEEQLQKLKMNQIYTENGMKLVEELQIMFGQMMQGHINYANPKGVLNHLMEKMSNRKVEVGLQKDLVEFLGLFFECLEAGFSISKEVYNEYNSKNFKEAHRINIFQGNLRSFINSSENGKEISKKKESFGCVILNVKDRNVENAWKSAWKTEISDFKISDDSEEQCTVVKREFVSDIPEMLIFQINRVEYTDRLEMVKINTRFDFEKELYIDQFLETNSKDVLKNETDYLKVENQLNILRAQLEMIDNYYGEQRSLLGKN